MAASKAPPKNLTCRYCGGKMKFAWPAPSHSLDSRGNIMACDKCRSTCQAIGRKNWDWRKA